jgi:hypothetical protein
LLEYFNHHVIKDTIAAFGTLFNDIWVARYDSAGNEVGRIKIPLSYGPKMKFIVRAEMAKPDLTHNVESVLPRLGFEMNSLKYDESRKLATTQRTLVTGTTGGINFRYEKVPYNLDMSLHVLCKNTDDALQIIEQILPYFTPDLTITLKSLVTDRQVDVPFSIGNLTFDESYEGNFEERKTFIASIPFTAKINLYGPVKTAGLIRTVETSFYDFDLMYGGATGATMATVIVGVTGGATAGSIGPTGTYYTHIIEPLG